MSKKKTKSKPANGGLRALFSYHRYLGLGAAAFIIILSITGIMLNHTDSLKMDERPVERDWLLSVYGIHEPKAGPAFEVQGHHISQWGEQVFYDTQALESLAGSQLMGAVPFQDMLVIATSARLVLFTQELEFVDELTSDEADEIKALGIGNDNQVLVKTVSEQQFNVDPDFTELNLIESISKVDWLSPRELPDNILQDLKQGFRGAGLPLERVILDLHSGRLLGLIGVYLMDSAAILMLLLTFTGLGIWVSRVMRRGRSKAKAT